LCPSCVSVESRIGQQVVKVLRRRGHEIIDDHEWFGTKLQAIRLDRNHAVIQAAASLRGIDTYAMGW
jgi:gamma-glutamyltranspeptidase/glutathione hydrolase